MVTFSNALEFSSLMSHSIKEGLPCATERENGAMFGAKLCLLSELVMCCRWERAALAFSCVLKTFDEHYQF